VMGVSFSCCTVAKVIMIFGLWKCSLICITGQNIGFICVWFCLVCRQAFTLPVPTRVYVHVHFYHSSKYSQVSSVVVEWLAFIFYI
jgi:hypothetical protein